MCRLCYQLLPGLLFAAADLGFKQGFERAVVHVLAYSTSVPLTGAPQFDGGFVALSQSRCQRFALLSVEAGNIGHAVHIGNHFGWRLTNLRWRHLRQTGPCPLRIEGRGLVNPGNRTASVWSWRRVLMASACAGENPCLSRSWVFLSGASAADPGPDGIWSAVMSRSLVVTGTDERADPAPGVPGSVMAGVPL